MRTLLSGLTTLVVAIGTLMFASPAEATTRYTVTATVSAINADVGTRVTVAGRVSTGARGQRILVQRRTGSAWATVATARVKRHGAYSASTPVVGPGDNLYRVVKPRHRNRLRGVSPVLTVVGWRWRSVMSFPPDTMSFNQAVVPSVTFRELTLGPALKLGSPSAAAGYATFKLGRQCTKFDALVGVTADSATFDPLELFAGVITQPAAPYLIQDQQSVRYGEHPVRVYYGPGIMQAAEGIFLGATTSPGDYVAWGDPRVYCRS